MSLDLDYLEAGLVGSGSCYTGVDADELLALIRVVRAAVAWRDAYVQGYATRKEWIDYVKSQERIHDALREAGL